MIILDTDHCIAILRQKLDLGNHVAPDDELFITSITVSELTHGADRSKHREDNLARLEVLFSAFTVLPFDEMAARRCGHLKLNWKSKVSHSMTWIFKLQVLHLSMICLSQPIIQSTSNV